MSWLGDHISSISGKLQDIGKAVNENINSSFLDVGQISLSEDQAERAAEKEDYADDDLSNEQSTSNMVLHQNHMLLVDQLTAEKEELEKKIILLDEQYQETLDELLQRKSELAAENKRLKSQLQKKSESKQSTNSSSFSDSLNKLDKLDTSDPKSVLENINVLLLLMPLRDHHGKIAIKNQIDQLRKINDELRAGGHVTEPDVIESVTKINTYIEYLNFICDHEQKLLPFMKEVADTVLEKPIKNNAGTQCDMNVEGPMPDSVSQHCQTDASQFLKHTFSTFSQTERIGCPHCEEISSKLLEVSMRNDQLEMELMDLRFNEKMQADNTISVSCQTECTDCKDCAGNKENAKEISLENERLKQEMVHLTTELESAIEKRDFFNGQVEIAIQKAEAEKVAFLEAQKVICLLKEEIHGVRKSCKDDNDEQKPFLDWMNPGCDIIVKDEHLKLINDAKKLKSSVTSKEELIIEKNAMIADLSEQLKNTECDSKRNLIELEKVNETLTKKLHEKQVEYNAVFEENKILSDKLFESNQKAEEKAVSSFSSQTESINCLKCIRSKDIIKDLLFSNDSLKQEIINLANKQKISSESKTSVSQQTDAICECEELKVKLQKATNDADNIMEQMEREKSDLRSQLEKQISISKNLTKSVQDRETVVSTMEKTVFTKMQDIMALNRTVSSLQQKLSDMEKQMAVYDMEKQSTNSVEVKENNIVHVDRGQEQLSMSVCDNDKLILQEKLKTLDLEKNRLLSVLSDKSRECSSLKSEVHRLTSIVASEKQALFKLQQDNKDLKDCRENGLDPDLTREALKNLSQLVRSKDVEIEALKQKNDSLSEIVKQSCSGADQVQNLIGEREDLLKQIIQFKANRDKIMSSYNNKDQECRSQLAEIKTLKTELDSRNRELDSLQQQYSSVSQQYEEKQKALITTQNETIMLKQQVSELKQHCEEAEHKHEELLHQINSDTCVMLAADEHSKLLSDVEELRFSISSKEKLINEKDSMIHDLSQNLKSIKLTSSELEKTITELKKAIKNLSEILEEKELVIVKAAKEKELLNDRLSDKQSELNLLKDMNERLNMALKEKEFSVESLEEKINDLSKVILGSSGSPSSESGSLDVDQILTSSKDMYLKAQSFHRERDETLLALTQCQQENQELRNEIQRLRTVEEHMKSELDRLRKHLLQVEENYTNEALRAEEREKELRNHLAELEQSVRLSSNASLDASHQANVQISSLQEQISIIAQQRDQALGQLSDLEDKVQQYAASLSNLQLVLEQKQKGHDRKMKELEKRYDAKLGESQNRCLELQNLLEKKQIQLEESSEALEAASRLSEQLDAKEEIISHLKEDLARAETKMKSTVQEIDCIKSNSEGKVDRVVMKSLVLGYFSTPPGQKSEVIRLLARVLDFNQEEMAKAGIVVSRNTGTIEHRGIFSSILGRLPSLSPVSIPRPLGSTQLDNRSDSSPSFTTLFVKFLENESQPVVHAPMDAEKMAREMTSKAHSNRSSSKSLASASMTPTRSPLFVGIDAAFPNFGPFPAIEHSTPSPTILKRVLD